MTVAQCLKKWLNAYPGADFGEIDTDIIEGANGSRAIFKSPNKTVIKYNDGSSLNTEFYQFYAKQPVLLEEERVDNQQFMADLESWIECKDYNEEYPDLSKVGNLLCTKVSINNSSTITYESEDKAIYHITIAIEYLKEM